MNKFLSVLAFALCLFGTASFAQQYHVTHLKQWGTRTRRSYGMSGNTRLTILKLDPLVRVERQQIGSLFFQASQALLPDKSHL